MANSFVRRILLCMEKSFQDLIIDHLAEEIRACRCDLTYYLRRRVQTVWREVDLRTWEFADAIGVSVEDLESVLRQKLFEPIVVERQDYKLRKPHAALEFVEVKMQGGAE